MSMAIPSQRNGARAASRLLTVVQLQDRLLPTIRTFQHPGHPQPVLSSPTTESFCDVFENSPTKRVRKATALGFGEFGGVEGAIGHS